MSASSEDTHRDDAPLAFMRQSLTRPDEKAIKAFHESLSHYWQPVLRASELASGQVHGVTLLDVPVALARLNGELVAMLDVCRHFQAQLSLGQIVDVSGVEAIQCPYHGWCYDKSGQCVRIPQQQADTQISRRARVPSFKAAEALGIIWVCLSDTPRFPLPHFDQYDDAQYRITTLDEQEPTRTACTRMIMATLDDTHFPWVHPGILGDPEQPLPPEHHLKRDGYELQVSYQTLQPNSLASGAGNSGDAVNITYDNRVHMPNVLTLKKTTPAGTYVVWLATSPINYSNTRNFWTFARDYDTDPARDQEYAKFSALVREQDKPIVESQRPWILPPFWSGVGLPQSPADLPLIGYQQWLQELGIGHEI